MYRKDAALKHKKRGFETVLVSCTESVKKIYQSFYFRLCVRTI